MSRPVQTTPGATVTRDFAATVFVVWRGRILLHKHAKLGMWLPPGGHVEPDEIPDDAAVREVREESGVAIELTGERALDVAEPRQLVRPRGVQLERIAADHEHIDLIYFGVPVEPYDGGLLEGDASLGWYGPRDVERLPLTDELVRWCVLAFEEAG